MVDKRPDDIIPLAKIGFFDIFKGDTVHVVWTQHSYDGIVEHVFRENQVPDKDKIDLYYDSKNNKVSRGTYLAKSNSRLVIKHGDKDYLILPSGSYTIAMMSGSEQKFTIRVLR